MNEVGVSQEKDPYYMQTIANVFHFTKQDLLLNREGKLSEMQRKRMWRRFWMALILMLIIFGLGGVILGVSLWGTAPEGTFTFLPPNTSVSNGIDNEDFFLLLQIFACLFPLVFIVAIGSMISMFVNIRHGELHTYRGMIRITEGYDDYHLHLIDDGRSFDIYHDQYHVLASLVDQRSFVVYYVLTREGIVSLEPI